APSPADKAVIDRGRRAILGRTIAPATTAFQYLHNAADDAAIIGSFDTAYVRRGEVRSASTAHRSAKIDFCARSRSPPKTNQDRIVRAEELMSFDPSSGPRN